eukprot:6492384-Amphidinium_carterae.2
MSVTFSLQWEASQQAKCRPEVWSEERSPLVLYTCADFEGDRMVETHINRNQAFRTQSIAHLLVKKPDVFVNGTGDEFGQACFDVGQICFT